MSILISFHLTDFFGLHESLATIDQLAVALDRTYVHRVMSIQGYAQTSRESGKGDRTIKQISVMPFTLLLPLLPLLLLPLLLLLSLLSL